MIKLNQVAYVRSNGEDDDFVENCRLLDEDLDRRTWEVTYEKICTASHYVGCI